MAVTWSDYTLPHPRAACDEAILAAERELGVRLPGDFVAVARVHQGRTPSPAAFTLADGSNSILNDLLHFEPAVSLGNLCQTWRQVRELLPAGVIPFAGDPFGNLLCFDYRASASAPPVLFWAHDEPGAALQPVAASFTELLERLHD